LKDVYAHKWFTRLWVHEEVVLVIHCKVLFHYYTVPYLDLIVVGATLLRQLRQMPDTPTFMNEKLYYDFVKILDRVQWRAWQTIRKVQLEHGGGPASNDLVDARSLLRDLRATAFLTALILEIAFTVYWV
jgi:hypothetical protein